MPLTLTSIFAVAFGSAIGGASRYYLSATCIRWLGPSFPYGTLAINIVGSFLIGILFEATGHGGRWEAPVSMRLFLMSGFCGGFTTFSAFSLETLNLVRDGFAGRAAANAALSLVLCLAAVWMGHAMAAGPLSKR